ncbi:MAG: hypothetical protein ACOVR6_10980 [Fimbriimonas sp.]
MKEMKCPRCQGLVPDRASFCPNCGNDVRAFRSMQASPPPPPSPPVQQPLTRQVVSESPQVLVGNPTSSVSTVPSGVVPVAGRNYLGWMVASLLGLGLIGVGLFALQLLKRLDTQPAGDVLSKTERAAPAIMQKTGTTAPVLERTETAPIGMPDDIRRWLEHLERIERMRGTLAQKGLANMMVLAQAAQFGTDIEGLSSMATGDPDAKMPTTSADKVAQKSSETKKEWVELKREFDSYPPPAECKTIADSYSHALDETGGMIGDILDAVDLSKNDTTKALETLYGMKNTSKAIDEFGVQTDQKVQAICDHYNTRKWFSINSDFGNSSIFSSLGMR